MSLLFVIAVIFFYRATSYDRTAIGVVLGDVSISMMDRPIGRRTIVPCYLSIAEWSVAQSDSSSYLLKQPPVF